MKALLLIFFFCAATLHATPKTLKLTDVQGTMDELFSYHVEYKELTPQIVKRSFKVFIESFDPARIYLLKSEVQPYLELSPEQIDRVIEGYNNNDFTYFKNLNDLIASSIKRAQKIRLQVKNEAQPQLGEAYSSYPKNQDDLKNRITKQFAHFIYEEKPADALSQENRDKLFTLWSRRLERGEDSYLQNGGKGEHYLTTHILKSLAKSLDAHTAYYSPEEAFELRTALEKQFEGIGVVLKEGIDGVVVVGLVKGGPAEKSGKINAGDIIVSINSKSTKNLSYEEVLARLKGQKGEPIVLGLQAQGKQAEVELKRDKILMEDERVQSTAMPFAEGIIGKIDLPSFYESGDGSSCERDLREEIKNLKKQGNLLGIVLDMRENSGGFLTQAVKVSGLFITSGVIVISKYAEGEVQYLRNVDARSFYSGPLIILTSKASASAAEIVAQALQDYGTAIIVGDERTYGKGSIQYQTVTDDDAKAYFKVTVGRYYTVSGKSTQIEGVQADIVVPTAYSALHIGEKYLEYPLASDQMPPAFIDTLSDMSGTNKQWFQKNYLPYLQKKESSWRKMLPVLQQDSTYRLVHDKDFSLYVKYLQEHENYPPREGQWGVEDLQMTEAINIIRDMIYLQQNDLKIIR